ncbi:MAG: dihydrofolate reductase family protein [Desulfurococcales archaeon]|nr:dihydrofolate reductase family protein [Desulfurococcales archaeon]
MGGEGARPYIFTFSTQTLDGRLAPPGVGRYTLSCPDDLRLQHELRAGADAVAVGANTVIMDNPRLTVRLVPGRSPARVVFDSNLRTPATAKVYQPPGLRVLVTREGHPPERLEPYRALGVRVVQARSSDPREAVVELRRMGIRRLMVEGGGGLIGSLLSAGVVDEVRVTVAPEILGDGAPLARIPGARARVRLALEEARILCGWWVHLRYSVLEPKWGYWA